MFVLKLPREVLLLGVWLGSSGLRPPHSYQEECVRARRGEDVLLGRIKSLGVDVITLICRKTSTMVRPALFLTQMVLRKMMESW